MSPSNHPPSSAGPHPPPAAGPGAGGRPRRRHAAARARLITGVASLVGAVGITGYLAASPSTTSSTATKSTARRPRPPRRRRPPTTARRRTTRPPPPRPPARRPRRPPHPPPSSAPPAMAADRRFRAMGSDAHLVVVGAAADALADRAQARIDQLEARWSRFRADSEISRLNRRAGTPVRGLARHRRADRAGHRGLAVLRRGVRSHCAGSDDPGRLRPVLRRARRRQVPSGVTSLLGLGAADIVIDGDEVTLPAGTGFDAGRHRQGSGRRRGGGRALAAGADGACVNLGGDVRVAGCGPDGGPWTVGVWHPESAEPVTRVGLADGAVATSTTRLRRWTVGGAPRPPPDRSPLRPAVGLGPGAGHRGGGRGLGGRGAGQVRDPARLGPSLRRGRGHRGPGPGRRPPGPGAGHRRPGRLPGLGHAARRARPVRLRGTVGGWRRLRSNTSSTWPSPTPSTTG